MKLTDKQCRNAKATNKDLKLSDGGGLFLLTKTDGKKYWHMSYRYLGKQKLLSFGPYPKTSLSKARTEREKNKQLLSQGKDPSEVRKQQKLDLQKKTENDFYSVAMRWYDIKKSKVNKKTAQTILNRLNLDIFPYIGTSDISAISPKDLLKVLQKVQSRGVIEVAHRLLWICAKIFDYARIEGLVQTNPTWGLNDGLKRKKIKHRACIKADQIPALLKKFADHAPSLNPIKIFAFKLLMLTFVRTSELIGATWDEFDLDKKVWTIPAARMKMKREHRVPLSKDVIKILHEIKSLYPNTKWILPCIHNDQKHTSNITVLHILWDMDYKGKMTGHGFRSLAMTTMMERTYRFEIIDRQLAHLPKNELGQTYDRAEFWDERVKLMQDWADYLDKITQSIHIP